jgi:hypothetical protein
MKNASWLLAVGVGLSVVGPAAADVNVNAPFVHVQVGGGVHIRAPFVNLYLPSAPRRMMVPAETVGNTRIVPEVVVPEGVTPPVVVLPDERSAPPVPQVLPARAPTLTEFAAGFAARPGNYEVWLQHPVTCCPVKVCFTLKGCPRRVVVHRQEIVFRYGLCDTVRLEFCTNGSVRVHY